MRSWLFVPGDSERKLEKVASAGADVVIIDLEDSVAIGRKAAARDITAECLNSGLLCEPTVYVRLNDLNSGWIADDIAAVMQRPPDGVMLPKCAAGRDVTHVHAMLRVAEAENGLADESTRIAVIATETAGALFQLGTYYNCSSRLTALAWGAEDLSADLGAEANRRVDGTYTDPYRLARTLTLAGAAHANVLAIDTVFTDFRDLDGLRAEAGTARRDGFSGKLAIHPAQVPIINEVFTPSAAAIERAKRVVAAFAEIDDAGVASLDGKMIDRPHLRQAERILGRMKNDT